MREKHLFSELPTWGRSTATSSTCDFEQGRLLEKSPVFFFFFARRRWWLRQRRHGQLLRESERAQCDEQPQLPGPSHGADKDIHFSPLERHSVDGVAHFVLGRIRARENQGTARLMCDTNTTYPVILALLCNLADADPLLVVLFHSSSSRRWAR